MRKHFLDKKQGILCGRLTGNRNLKAAASAIQSVRGNAPIGPLLPANGRPLCRDEPTGGSLGGREHIFPLNEKSLFHCVPPIALPRIHLSIGMSHRSALGTTAGGGQPPSDVSSLPGAPVRVKPRTSSEKKPLGPLFRFLHSHGPPRSTLLRLSVRLGTCLPGGIHASAHSRSHVWRFSLESVSPPLWEALQVDGDSTGFSSCWAPSVCTRLRKRLGEGGRVAGQEHAVAGLWK